MVPVARARRMSTRYQPRISNARNPPSNIYRKVQEMRSTTSTRRIVASARHRPIPTGVVLWHYIYIEGKTVISLLLLVFLAAAVVAIVALVINLGKKDDK